MKKQTISNGKIGIFFRAPSEKGERIFRRAARLFSVFFQKNVDKSQTPCYNIIRFAAMAQSVEHIIGNDEVTSSILVSSSKKSRVQQRPGFFRFSEEEY